MIWELIHRAFAGLTVQTPPSLAVAGERAMFHATNLWERAIHDPRKRDADVNDRRCAREIDQFIKDGLGWTWEPPYEGDGDFEWCGAFAAFCWQSIRPELRKVYWSSTYRLDRYARYQSAMGEKNKGSGRLIANLDETSTTLPWEPRAGDILLIGPKGSGYGKHICLVESYADRVFKTIEGNGTGLAPDRTRWQGVVRGTRYLGTRGHASDGVALKVEWCARRLIRPSVEDLVR